MAFRNQSHVKHRSRRTLGDLLSEAESVDISFAHVGRVPALAKSMILVARRP